jgi:predicted RNA-binding protein (TIGR00451 family)
VLAEHGIRWLHSNLPAPHNRVDISPEILDFIRKGRSVFAKHVLQADPAIRPQGEVLIVSGSDQLIGLGRAKISGEAMMGAQKGVAVKPIHILSTLVSSQ